ncbi:MAG: hypothetical protein RLZZ622_1635 [Planctomycetota bacterium]
MKSPLRPPGDIRSQLVFHSLHFGHCAASAAIRPNGIVSVRRVGFGCSPDRTMPCPHVRLMKRYPRRSVEKSGNLTWDLKNHFSRRRVNRCCGVFAVPLLRRPTANRSRLSEIFPARAGFLPGRHRLTAIVRRTVGTAARLFRGQPHGETHVLIRFSSAGRTWFLLG